MTTPGLIAKKIGMTRMVDADGRMTAVTLLQVEPQKITKVLTPERDGYHGIQVGYYIKPERRLNKADVSRLRQGGVAENYTRFREFRLQEAVAELKVGVEFNVKALEGVPTIDATGLTRGRGFAGAHVRWNASVGRMSHGSRFHRSPGSLGMRSTPGRVMKNRHQPGHCGHVQVTIQNLNVLDIDKKNNIVAVKGSVPGHRDGLLVLAPSIKVVAAGSAAGAKS